MQYFSAVGSAARQLGLQHVSQTEDALDQTIVMRDKRADTIKH
jgi:hypothetical protein